jgi:cyanophycin synthetase
MIKNPPIIKRVVREMGGSIEEVVPERGCFNINLRGKKIFVSRKFKISRNVIVGDETTKYKDVTYAILVKEGLPTPKTVCFYEKRKKNSLLKKLSTLKFPVIVKDSEGSNSKGIFPNLTTIATAKKTILKQLKKFPRLIAQEMVSGNEFRVLVLRDRIIGALRLIPPRIIGDGQKTVLGLIKEKQKNTRKKTPLDSTLKKILREQGTSLTSIPQKDEVIYIKKTSSLDEGGETEDVTHKVHAGIKKICIKAAEKVAKELAGIDVICDNIAKDPKKQLFNIIEINGKPDIYIHYNPTYGKTRNVVKDIINFILRLEKK